MLKRNHKIRDEIAKASSIEQFRSCIDRLKETFEPYHIGEAVWVNDDEQPKDYNLSLPPWICQPYIRKPPEEHIEYIAQKEKEAAEREKIDYFDGNGEKISKNVLKKLKKATNKRNSNEIRRNNVRSFELCNAMKCSNPMVRHISEICVIHDDTCSYQRTRIVLKIEFFLFLGSEM